MINRPYRQLIRHHIYSTNNTILIREVILRVKQAIYGMALKPLLIFELLCGGILVT